MTTTLNEPLADSQSTHSNAYDEAPHNESQYQIGVNESIVQNEPNMNYTTLPSESTYTEPVVETSNPNYTAREPSYRPATQSGPLRLSAINIDLGPSEVQNQTYVSTNQANELLNQAYVSNETNEVQNQTYATNQNNEVKNEAYQAVEQCEQNELANPIYADGNNEQNTEMANPVYQS